MKANATLLRVVPTENNMGTVSASLVELAADAPGRYSSRDELGAFRDAALQELEDAGFEDIAEEQDEPPRSGEAVAASKQDGRGTEETGAAPESREHGQDSGRARGPELATAEQTDQGNQRAFKREDPGVVLTADQGRALQSTTRPSGPGASVGLLLATVQRLVDQPSLTPPAAQPTIAHGGQPDISPRDPRRHGRPGHGRVGVV